jgi:hypothetical protein
MPSSLLLMLVVKVNLKKVVVACLTLQRVLIHQTKLGHACFCTKKEMKWSIGSTQLPWWLLLAQKLKRFWISCLLLALFYDGMDAYLQRICLHLLQSLAGCIKKSHHLTKKMKFHLGNNFFNHLFKMPNQFWMT